MCKLMNYFKVISMGIIFIFGVEACAAVSKEPVKSAAAKKEKSTITNKETKKAVGKTEEKKTKKTAKKPTIKKVTKKSRKTNPNSFNRLLNRSAKKNLNPEDDGIHDPRHEATLYLQTPLEAFAGISKVKQGNKIDWVKAMDNKKIQPRYSLKNPTAKPIVMDMNVVLQVKGFMPDVVFPHKQHTQWLDCSNCHPAIFIPMKGANKISMADNLRGEKCGVCHGKVAFPLSRCAACHSSKKKKVASVKK